MLIRHLYKEGLYGSYLLPTLFAGRNALLGLSILLSFIIFLIYSRYQKSKVKKTQQTTIPFMIRVGI